MGIVVGKTPWQSARYEVVAVQTASLGSTMPTGGNLICRNGGVAWIVAPSSSQVVRNWHNRNDAVTMASSCTAATGWFIPDVNQLYNPGYTGSTYWDSFEFTYYWSSTEASGDATRACFIFFYRGGDGTRLKTSTYNVRAFRCVTY